MRDRYVLVLSKSISEGNQYAKRAGLPRFSYRAVGNAASIRNLKVADVHILPSFDGRRDKHQILAELRWGRDIEYFYVEMPPKSDEPAVDQGDGMGQQLSIDDVEPEPNLVELITDGAHGTPESLRAAAEAELAADLQVPDRPKPEGTDAQTAPPEPSEDPAPTEASKRRRSRCKTCNQLHFADEPCVQKVVPLKHKSVDPTIELVSPAVPSTEMF
jgi:hypothetical protein